MKKGIFKLVIFALVVVVMSASLSCKKKEVKKISIDNHMALSLFYDTVYMRDLLNELDSTTTSWLRVKDDGTICVYYADSVMEAVKASVLIGDNIEDVPFSTTTDFTLDPVEFDDYIDTTLLSNKFTSIPFEYDRFIINEVIMRKGTFSFSIDVNPPIPQLKTVVIFSPQLLDKDNQPLEIVIDNAGGRQSIDLADCKVIPDEDSNVNFSAWVTIEFTPGGFPGGDFVCDLNGGLTDVGFKTVSARVTKSLDSIFSQTADIDLSLGTLDGSVIVNLPDININYRNTFNLGAHCDITKIDLVGDDHTYDLLGGEDTLNIDVLPTNGEFLNQQIHFGGQLDLLEGYKRIDFNGKVTVAKPGDIIAISDTSQIDVIAELEMPLSFRIEDLHYRDTIDVNFSDEGSSDVNIDDYFDEINLYIDYDNHIPLEVAMQGLFMKNGRVIDSLFNSGNTLLYDKEKTISCKITGNKLKNVMRANQMIIRLGVSTEFQDEPVVLKDTEYITLRMRMLTKTSEIDIDDL